MIPGEAKSEAHRLQCFRIIDTGSPRLLKQQPFLSVITFVPVVPNVENAERRRCIGQKKVAPSFGVSWSVHFRPRLELGENAFHGPAPREVDALNRGSLTALSLPGKQQGAWVPALSNLRKKRPGRLDTKAGQPSHMCALRLRSGVSVWRERVHVAWAHDIARVRNAASNLGHLSA